MFVWFGHEGVVAASEVTRKTWVEARAEVELAARSIERLKFSFGGLLEQDQDWSKVRETHSRAVDLLQRVVKIDYSGAEETSNARELWNTIVGPDGPIMSAIKVTSELERRLLLTYPIDVPDSLGISSRFRSAFHPG
ncbi:hypothetical protein [Gordonia sp. NB41Y]|uniref:hypothetical protein n=1 Tax=Gordonia sp. NB41Y TaxID=875808 RepID=UPI0006B22498|nr:hypothetical protein [Gordonia sp. NB41Y]KOY49302.1 hypothetical protein ISGA_11095 [Gordonia sp. NB41Y]WLP90591.1 hypothetical protein Q9K23_24390 [Gordonia sp. NB41Y]